VTATAITDRVQSAWDVLQGVPDPELPMVSLCDLGIVREVLEDAAGIHVVLTPTYSGCPATEDIAAAVRDALQAAGLGPARVTQQWAPAWTTDWISAQGRQRLQQAGIAPPGPVSTEERTMFWRPRAIACPRCNSADTELLSAFGSTACKALHRCRACREPFEHFKPL